MKKEKIFGKKNDTKTETASTTSGSQSKSGSCDLYHLRAKHFVDHQTAICGKLPILEGKARDEEMAVLEGEQHQFRNMPQEMPRKLKAAADVVGGCVDTRTIDKHFEYNHDMDEHLRVNIGTAVKIVARSLRKEDKQVKKKYAQRVHSILTALHGEDAS